MKRSLLIEVLLGSIAVLVAVVIWLAIDAVSECETRVEQIDRRAEELAHENEMLREQLEATKAMGGLETPIEPPEFDQFIFPVAERDYLMITSPDGPRVSPFTGVWQNHNGVDIAAVWRAVAVAAADGVVVEHWPPPGTPVPGSSATYTGHEYYGGMVRIEHDDGIESLYAHFSETFVRTGQRVRSGQNIGRIGATGRATGNHLHFEIIVDGQRQNPLHYIPMPGGQ